jgi:3-oxoacyl-ACP reductase-like protein
MSVFGLIKDAIFGRSANAAVATSAPAASAPATPAASASATPADATPQGAKPGAAKMSAVDVAAVLDKLDEKSDEDFDWRHSIVDLMKLLKLDSSLGARRELAKELGYTGDTGDSAKMNIWLHKQVMIKLAEHGGTVPAELTH